MNQLGIEEFHHIALSVRDIEKMVDFICGNLGFEKVVEDKHRSGEMLDKVVGLTNVDAHVVLLKGYGIHLELFKYRTPAGKEKEPIRQCDFGLTHFCLRVKNIETAYRQLRVRGVEFNSPPQHLRPGAWAVYIQGPENLVIELAQYDQSI